MFYAKIFAYTSPKKQGIIQKKSASGGRTLPFVIFDKKVPFFSKIGFILTYFLVTHRQNCPFFLRFQTLPLNSRLHSEKVLQYNDKSIVLTSTIFVRLQPPNVK